MYLAEEQRRAFTVVGLSSDPTRLPATFRYDYASWSWNGARVLASGAGEDGRVGLRWIDPATGSVQLISDSGSIGLWMQDAVERPNGQIVALGSPNGANSPQRLYDSSGTPLTTQIGFAAPERVTWSPDRSAALVVVNDGVDAPLLCRRGQWGSPRDYVEHRRGAGSRVGRRCPAADHRSIGSVSRAASAARAWS